MGVVAVAPAAAAVVVVVATDAASSNGVVNYLATFGAGALFLAALNAYFRRRAGGGVSGEGPSSAARDVGIGAAAMAESIKELLAPLNKQIADLAATNADLQHRIAEKTHEQAETLVKLADAQADLSKAQAQAMTERHDQAERIAVLEATLARLRADHDLILNELETYRIRSGEAPDRRTPEDRRGDI